ncbi:MAG TPA: hypothetical protein VFT12_04430 [Thermoanaerobaculia bacterium]|nr:hypothetical protein [Thermoanaerobaculia bacterium]
MSAAVVLLDPDSRDFYVRSMTILQDADVPFLVGGAYALARYTGIERHTKDFDVFIRRSDYERAAAALAAAGYETDLTFPHWIGKAFQGEDFIDLIFSAGNGVAEVDDLWFEHAVPETVLGMEVGLIPAEEMIWSKGLIMERERFDGADVAHMIKNVGLELDWQRLVDRYGKHWRVLFSHLIVYGFVYPSRRGNIPKWVMHELAGRLAAEMQQPDTSDKVCHGTIISRQQYLLDVHEWGFADARLKEHGGKMTAEEVEHWTKGIEVDGAGT